MLQAFFYMGVPLKDYLADTNQGCNIQKAKVFSIIEQPLLCLDAVAALDVLQVAFYMKVLSRRSSNVTVMINVICCHVSSNSSLAQKKATAPPLFAKTSPLLSTF